MLQDLVDLRAIRERPADHSRDATLQARGSSRFGPKIAKLESRVLSEPGDRDAWLVLGAELFLSGQTRRAADVFLRLTDRKPDGAIAAFLDAASPPGTAAR